MSSDTLTGGEEVYSSDALPPVPVPPPPPTFPSRSAGDVLDSESIPATKAIETFRHGGETRHEKLDRIKRELEELDRDSSVDHIGISVRTLQEKLEGLTGTNILMRQMELTKMVASSGNVQKGADNSSAFIPNNVSSHEERLLRIEAMLGSDKNSTSVIERLKKAEQNLQSVNEKSLSQAASRAKVIRADLEAAAKARSKIQSSTQDSVKVSKLYNQMTELDGFLSSDSHVLNAIVNRLEACAELHLRSMDFGKTVDSLEVAVTDVKSLLASMDDSVGSLEKGMEDNMKIIQENMEALDKRLGDKS